MSTPNSVKISQLWVLGARPYKISWKSGNACQIWKEGHRQQGDRASLHCFLISSGFSISEKLLKLNWLINLEIRGKLNHPPFISYYNRSEGPDDTHSLLWIGVAAKQIWDQQTYTNKVYSNTELVLMRDRAAQNKRRHRSLSSNNVVRSTASSRAIKSSCIIQLMYTLKAGLYIIRVGSILNWTPCISVDSHFRLCKFSVRVLKTNNVPRNSHHLKTFTSIYCTNIYRM